MSKTFAAIRKLVASGEFRISDHGYDELAEDDIRVRDLVDGLADATVVEDYPDFPKGPAVLVLQSDSSQFTPCGVSRRADPPPQFWSQLIALTPHAGMKDSWSGADEQGQ